MYDPSSAAFQQYANTMAERGITAGAVNKPNPTYFVASPYIYQALILYSSATGFPVFLSTLPDTTTTTSYSTFWRPEDTTTAFPLCGLNQLPPIHNGIWNCTGTAVLPETVCSVMCLGRSELRTADTSNPDMALSGPFGIRKEFVSATCAGNGLFGFPDNTKFNQLFCASMDTAVDTDDGATAVVVMILLVAFFVLVCGCTVCLCQRKRWIGLSEEQPPPPPPPQAQVQVIYQTQAQPQPVVEYQPPAEYIPVYDEV
jgi:hypothetical protein